jgi:DNA-binding NarL/FixJ family response regulator
MIRIFVIDDHPVIASGIRYILHTERDGIKIAHTALNVEEAISTMNPDDFDIIILDLYIPDTHPSDNVKKLKIKYPGKKIIIYTSETSTMWIRKMFEVGADAYITKDGNRPTLKTAIHKVFVGETVFPACLTLQDDQIGIKEFRENCQSQPLQPQQCQILSLLIDGLSVKQIAGKVNMNFFRVNNILRKTRLQFKAKNNVELAVKMVQHKELFLAVS